MSIWSSIGVNEPPITGLSDFGYEETGNADDVVIDVANSGWNRRIRLYESGGDACVYLTREQAARLVEHLNVALVRHADTDSA